MLIVLTVILAIGVLGVLAYPIVRQAEGQTSPAMTSAQETLADLLAERDAAFQSVRDLQFDHQVGKITDEDLAVFEANLKLNAANALRKLDAWENSMDRSLGAAIERQVAVRRMVLSRPGRACPQCGHVVPAGDSFCRACGAAVASVSDLTAGPSCPNCGRVVATDDRFCPECGQPLGQIASHA